MPKSSEPGRRIFDRYETDVDVKFYVSFDIQTKVDYRVKQNKSGSFSPEKYSGVTKNVSVEGLAFVSPKQLQIGDMLLLEIYLPSAGEPVRMEGQVRWCQAIDTAGGQGPAYDTGIKILTVEGQPVEKTVFIDNVHNVVWSIVLEAIFGSFKQLILKSKKS